MNKKIKVKASNSPLGGGSVRVYVGDKLVWSKGVKTMPELFKLDQEVQILVKCDMGKNRIFTKALRIV